MAAAQPMTNCWFVDSSAFDSAKHRIVCFPYAGGSAQVFGRWQRRWGRAIAVRAVQLPGRGTRLNEPCLTSIDAVAHRFLATAPRLVPPFALFGHSMGAIVAFEVARALRDSSGVEPELLVVSGARAPHLPRCARPIAQLPSIEFRNNVLAFGGTPRQVVDDEEAWMVFEPILRADIGAIEQYRFSEGRPLSCPILALGGTLDAHAGVDAIAPWRVHTTGRFHVRSCAGGHFFIHTHEAEVLDTLAEHLTGPDSPTAPISSVAGVPQDPRHLMDINDKGMSCQRHRVADGPDSSCRCLGSS